MINSKTQWSNTIENIIITIALINSVHQNIIC